MLGCLYAAYKFIAENYKSLCPLGSFGVNLTPPEVKDHISPYSHTCMFIPKPLVYTMLGFLYAAYKFIAESKMFIYFGVIQCKFDPARGQRSYFSL